MAPDGRRAPLALALAFVALAAAPPASALRLLDWNLLNYPGTTASTRDPGFRTIIGSIDPDLIVAEEVTSQSGVNTFLSDVLDVLEPGQWAALPFVDGNDTDAALFYRTSAFTALGQTSFYPDPSTNLRLIHVYTVRPVGYTTTGADIRLYAVHLKASKGSQCSPIPCETRRLTEATGMRDEMNAMPPGTHAFGVGDFNLYTGAEPALAKLLESQDDNDGQLYDPLGLQGVPWQDNASIAIRHTQSPCLTSPCANGAATGGLDDRFDLWLPTLNWNDGQGYELIPGGYVSVGNDGHHLNLNITDAPTIPEGAGFATALKSVSDHLPLRLDIQVPALSSVASSLDLGTVIEGGSADLAISNPATPPADGLTYSLAAPAGFTAPAGTLELPPGGATTDAIATAGGPAGPRAGDLTITSDDVDHPSRLVALTATVLDHARPSLDDASELLASTVDFGTHLDGEFSPQTVTVHNFAYSADQARLSLHSASIVGGEDRFSIQGGFTPLLLAGSGQPYSIVFDATGATPDAIYTATLTFSSADEPLPGAASRPDLAVTLTAQVGAGATAVSGPAVPARTQLYAPYPNPLRGSGSVRLDLAQATHVHLDLLDLTGRRVASLANRPLEPGRYTFAWSGRDGAGHAVPAGVYFVRVSGGGIHTQTVRLAILG